MNVVHCIIDYKYLKALIMYRYKIKIPLFFNLAVKVQVTDNENGADLRKNFKTCHWKCDNNFYFRKIYV